MAIIIKTLKSPWKQWNYKKFIISKLLSFLHSTWLILWFFMILLYTFPSSSEFIKLPGLGASPKSYVQALTENVAVLINHYYTAYKSFKSKDLPFRVFKWKLTSNPSPLIYFALKCQPCTVGNNQYGDVKRITHLTILHSVLHYLGHYQIQIINSITEIGK